MTKTKPKGRAARVRKTAAEPAISVGQALTEHLEERWPKAFTRPDVPEGEALRVQVQTVATAQMVRVDRLLRSGHVMSMLGINRKQLEKFIACGLLKPRRVPDPHRLSGRNREKRRGRPGGLIFLLSEVAGLTAKLPAAGGKL